MQFLYFLESLRTPFRDGVMSAVTFLGDETVFLVIALAVLWCVDKKRGYYLLCVGFVGTVTAQCLKLLCRVPRPWILDSDFTIVESARAAASDYSFPSGHTINAVGTFGALSVTAKRRAVRLAWLVPAVAVPFSRMYLGVHTPLDVSVGALISAVLLAAFHPFFFRGDSFCRRFPVLLSCMAAMAAGLVLFVECYPFPEDTLVS